MNAITLASWACIVVSVALTTYALVTVYRVRRRTRRR